MWTINLFCLMAVAFLVGNPVTAHAQGRGRANSHSSARPSDVAVDIDNVFGSGELRLIRSWFGNDANLSGLPQGLAKRDSLPAGLQRQLQKNGTLPPGLQQHVHSVPSDLNRRLPTLISGISRLIIGGSVVLVDA